MVDSPVLYLGLDIGIRGDTSALAAVYEGDGGELLEWGHRIWTPPVSITHAVEPFVMQILRTCRVAGLAFDWYQFESTREHLVEQGFASRLVEINQMTENPAFTMLLRTLFWDHKIGLTDEGEARNHLEWTATRETERGARIDKRKQSKKIDFTVALGMACLIASRDLGYLQHPTFATTRHTRSAVLLP